MKLLLDEHYSPQIAAGLRALGRDAQHLEERGLKGISDDALMQLAASDRRALMTNNVRDFTPLAQTWAAAGLTHYGLIFTSDSKWPRGKNTIDRFVAALDAFMDARPAEDAMLNSIWWL